MKKYFLATLGTIIFIPVITIGAELSKPLKDFLKNIFWHHWLGKSVLVIAVFVLLLFIFNLIFRRESASSTLNAPSPTTSPTGITAITTLALLSALVIFAFFTFEYFKHLS